MQGIISQSALGHFHSFRFSCKQRNKLKNSGSKWFLGTQQSYSESSFQHPTMFNTFVKHKVITIVITIPLIILLHAYQTYRLWCPCWNNHMSRHHNMRVGRCGPVQLAMPPIPPRAWEFSWEHRLVRWEICWRIAHPLISTSSPVNLLGDSESLCLIFIMYAWRIILMILLYL